jgi:hypothetical protein
LGLFFCFTPITCVVFNLYLGLFERVAWGAERKFFMYKFKMLSGFVALFFYVTAAAAQTQITAPIPSTEPKVVSAPSVAPLNPAPVPSTPPSVSQPNTPVANVSSAPAVTPGASVNASVPVSTKVTPRPVSVQVAPVQPVVATPVVTQTDSVSPAASPVTNPSTVSVQPVASAPETYPMQPAALRPVWPSFIISPGLGVGYETEELEKLMIGGNLRLGAAITERIQLFGELSGLYTSKDAIDWRIQDIVLRGKFFVYDNFFALAGLGITRAQACSELDVEDVGSLTGCLETDHQLLVSAGAGYEFRHGERFFFAPEVLLDYRKITIDSIVDNKEFWTPRLNLQVGWYF